jgi:hypothetical protein
MSRKTGKRTVPATEIDDVIEFQCDICGRTTTEEAIINDGGAWGPDDYHQRATTIQLRETEGGQYGGMGTESEFDICPDCFKGPLSAWIKSHRDAEPTTQDVSW